MIAYLSLGSNLGDRLTNLNEALRKLEQGGCRVLACSSVYETQPVDFAEQPDFLNSAVAVETSLEPLSLLECCLQIEQEMGRRRTVMAGPRTIDLDVLLLGNLRLDLPRLTVPHPRMHTRRFVLLPLAEIAPQEVHPLLGRTIQDLLAQAGDTSRVERYCGPLR